MPDNWLLDAIWLDFGLRFLMNAMAIFITVRLIYYPRHKHKDFVFTFFLFNAVNFLICFMLSASGLEMGFAFGLFAIFSIIRYRTVTVPIREMGYFFVSVALALMNALAPLNMRMVLANLILVLLVWLLDRKDNLAHESYQDVLYERMDLILPDRRAGLIEDLKTRTGLPVHRVEIVRVDFFRDLARIKAYYFSQANESPERFEGEED